MDNVITKPEIVCTFHKWGCPLLVNFISKIGNKWKVALRLYKRKKEKRRERRRWEGGKKSWEIPLLISVLWNTRTAKSREIMVLFAYMKFSDITMRDIRHPNDISQSKVPISDTVNMPQPLFQTDFACWIEKKNASNINVNLHYFNLKENHKISQNLLLWEFGKFRSIY